MSGKMNRRRFLKASAAAAGVGYFAIADVTESRACSGKMIPMNKLQCRRCRRGRPGRRERQRPLRRKPRRTVRR